MSVKHVGARELRGDLAEKLKGSEPIIIEWHGQVLGIYLPVQPVDREHAADRQKTIATTFAESRCAIMVERLYNAYEAGARLRIPDDPDDWHTIALAMATKTAIRTLDWKHFFGCGMVRWNTKIIARRAHGRRALG